MRTVKVYGGGPLVGKVFYGVLQSVAGKHIVEDNFGKKIIYLRLDEFPYPGKDTTDLCRFNIETGYVTVPFQKESDILRVDLAELDQTLMGFVPDVCLCVACIDYRTINMVMDNMVQ